MSSPPQGGGGTAQAACAERSPRKQPSHLAWGLPGGASTGGRQSSFPAPHPPWHPLGTDTPWAGWGHPEQEQEEELSPGNLHFPAAKREREGCAGEAAWRPWAIAEMLHQQALGAACVCQGCVRMCWRNSVDTLGRCRDAPSVGSGCSPGLCEGARMCWVSRVDTLGNCRDPPSVGSGCSLCARAV